ncbi:MAG: hypothetical protein K2P78_06345 [Gemmataceae bacterium]|nr:hypothetical protein [Gemmataceae bacterium]
MPTRVTSAVLAALVIAAALRAQPPAAPTPVPLVLETQFNQPADLAALRGSVVVLVYGDRKATDAARALGEQLHVQWHPDAKGQPPAVAHMAPVVGLPGLAPGLPAPDVKVIPVACCGKVPGAIRGPIRTQLAQAVPDVPIWLDFGDTMKTQFGLAAGEPNVVVFDAAGRLRMKIVGTPDRAATDRLTRAVDGLRHEAAAGK